MGIPANADIVVIGGGPSGAMAAALLAKNGLDVVLFEKEIFPRYAVGESLIPHFWKFTDLIGASEEIEKANFIKKGGGAAYWDGVLRAMSFAPYGHNRPGLHVEREEFDHIILNRAKVLGASVFEDCEVTHVEVSNKKNLIKYLYKGEELGIISSRYLIDASGQAAIVSRKLGLREFDPNFRFQAFWAYFDQSNYLNSEAEVTSFEHRFNDHPMSLVSGTGKWGWSWLLLLQNKVSVGAMLPRDELSGFKSGGKTLEERFINHVQKIPLTGKLVNGDLISEVKTIRDYAYLPSRLAFDQCYFTGDAAAFADPINSEGVTMSLYGGMMSAWAVQKSMEQQHRADFYREFYISNMQKRYKVFQLLSYPKHTIAPHLLESCIQVIKNQSEEETNLILAHLMVTNRAKDFPELLKALNIHVTKGWRELTPPEALLA